LPGRTLSAFLCVSEDLPFASTRKRSVQRQSCSYPSPQDGPRCFTGATYRPWPDYRRALTYKVGALHPSARGPAGPLCSPCRCGGRRSSRPPRLSGEASHRTGLVGHTSGSSGRYLEARQHKLGRGRRGRVHLVPCLPQAHESLVKPCVRIRLCHSW
jgi:hypothetical protein